MDNILAIILSAIGSVLACFLMFFADRSKRDLFFRKYFGLSFFKELKQINNRQQILKEFREVFIEYQCKQGGEIYLMSHSGSGGSSFDPWNRIRELASNSELTVHAAMTRGAFKEYASQNLTVIQQIVEKNNINLYLFDNQKPEYYRIGVNTELRKGFWGGFYSEEEYSQDKIEGFSTTNKIFIDAIINMYKGFLESGDKITTKNINQVLNQNYGS